MLHTISPRRFIYPLIFLVVCTAALCMLILTAPLAHADCNGTSTVIINCETQNGQKVDGTWFILLLILNILATGVGIVAVGGIAYAAFLYTTAADNESQLTKSKETITNTVLGIVTFALMYSGLQFLIPGGAFGSGGPVIAREAPKVTRVGSSGDKDSSKGGDSAEDDGSDTTKSNTATGLKNFRDASASGSILKPDVLFRSQLLNGMTPSEARALSNELGKGALIIDVRASGERSKKPDADIPNTQKRNIPIDGLLDQEHMVSDPVRRSQLREVFRAMANANGPVLIHCFAGKDRTGWIVAMVMHMSGASEAQIMREYMISKQAGKGFEVKQQWMNSGLNAAKQKYGSIRGYLKNGVGLTDGDIAKIQRKFKA